MSILNLYSAAEKPYQNLNVDSVDVEELLVDDLKMETITVTDVTVSSLDAGKFMSDNVLQEFDWAVGSNTLSRTYGVVRFNNMPEVKDNDGIDHIFTCNNSKLVLNSPVLLSFNMENVVINSNVKFSLDKVSVGSFNVRLSNFSGSDLTPLSVKMTYLIL